MPHQQCLPGNTSGLAMRATRTDFLNTTNPPHVQLGLPHDCGTMPLDDQLAQRYVRSYALCALSADGHARDRYLRTMPSEQQLHFDSNRLLRLPPGGLHRDHSSQSRHFRLPDRLLRLPHHERLESFDLQSLDRGLPADGRAYHGAMRAVPHKQQLHNACRRIAIAATRRIERDQQSAPRDVGLPHDLRHLPQHHGLDSGDIQSQQHGRSR